MLAFALGALPLIIYNIHHPLATFRGNTSWDTSDFAGKGRLLLGTANGNALFGWLNNEDWQTAQPHVPHGVVESSSAKISALFGHPRRSLLLYAFLLALLLAPLARGNALRAILFALVALAVAWIQMAITANAGGSVHHAILLWPLPQMIIAISFAAASRRLGACRYSGTGNRAGRADDLRTAGDQRVPRVNCAQRRQPELDHAIFRLADYMKATPASNIFCVDWGMVDSMRLMSRGKLPLRVGTDPISKKSLEDPDREYLARTISGEGHVFINHTKEFEFFAGVNDKLVKYAADAGYRREILTTIPTPTAARCTKSTASSADVGQASRPVVDGRSARETFMKKWQGRGGEVVWTVK